MTDENKYITANWPAPSNVHAVMTTRQGGNSRGCYDSNNLSSYVGDNEQALQTNRELLHQELSLPGQPLWLKQVHGIHVICADDEQPDLPEADASFSRQAGTVCVIQTADCLPVLLCDKQGSQVAAIHAGWRSLAAGVIEQTLKQFSQDSDDILAWLGPAIGPSAFEVGSDVYDAFVARDAKAASAFKPGKVGHWYADVYHLATQRLRSKGVTQIYRDARCTYDDDETFFSYRRDGDTGRMATLIWRD